MFRLGISNTQFQHWHEYQYLTSDKSLFVHLPQKLTAWASTAQTEQGNLKTVIHTMQAFSLLLLASKG